jgi:hypothetical protein
MKFPAVGGTKTFPVVRLKKRATRMVSMVIPAMIVPSAAPRMPRAEKQIFQRSAIIQMQFTTRPTKDACITIRVSPIPERNSRSMAQKTDNASIKQNIEVSFLWRQLYRSIPALSNIR